MLHSSRKKMPAGVGQVAMWHMFEFIHWPYSSFFSPWYGDSIHFFSWKICVFDSKIKETWAWCWNFGWKFAVKLSIWLKVCLQLCMQTFKGRLQVCMRTFNGGLKVCKQTFNDALKVSDQTFIPYLFLNCNKYKDWKFDCKLSRNPCKLACKLAIHPWKFTCKVSIYPWKFTCKVSGKLSIRLKVWLQTFNQSFKVSCMNLKIYGKKFMNFEWLNHKLIILANEYNSKTTFRISYSSF